MGIDVAALIAAQKAKLDSVEPTDVPVTVGDQDVTLRVWPVTGEKFNELEDLCQKSDGTGADYRLVAGMYPRTYIADGDDVQHVQGESLRDLIAVLSAPDRDAIGAVLWGINRWEPTQKDASAGKASTGGRAKKRR